MTHAACANNIEQGMAMPKCALAVSGRISQRVFFVVLGLLFLASTALTVVWCNSMAAMEGMPMPGGWTMSMMWMRMPGQTWSGSTASFLAMWVLMMGAMMLPSVAPVLFRYHQSVEGETELSRGALTALVGAGYFLVWALLGFTVFAMGVVLAAIEMRQAGLARQVPFAAGVAVLVSAALQFTKWKAHHLACCRAAPERHLGSTANVRTAWRQGVHFGVHCGLSCANLTAVLLVLGVMDLRAMAAVTVAITAERLAPAGLPVARVVGFVVAGAGLILIAQATGLR